MKFPSIRIEGAILAADILDKIETGDVAGQKPTDFGLASDAKVKDEIVRAWTDAQDLWRIFRRKLDALKPEATATSETRNFFVVPLLGLLGYQIELAGKGEVVNDKNYPISHRVPSRDGFPVHIMGWRDSLDKKREDSGPRMSPHALVQEYLNLTEHLYAVVTNGQQLRLLRDSSRLIKLSFLEFDLRRIFEEELFADFALLYRLLHVSRMPVNQASSAESIIELYHQDSLDSGSRIRSGLSKAVEDSIKALANGFLNHPQNQKLRDSVSESPGLRVSASLFYQWQLRLIYRLLFLMVTEERDLIFPKGADRQKRDIYYRYYSLNRLRKLSEKRHFADKNYQDAWTGLKSNFRLFEAGAFGAKLGIAPLDGDLFGYEAIGLLNECQLDNQTLLECFRNLSTFEHPDTRQRIRVNYGALNVEEFGSVYEGLLEYDPVITPNNHRLEFSFVQGEGRASSGSHYTPDELVQPLIQHSLDYLIADKLAEARTESSKTSKAPTRSPSPPMQRSGMGGEGRGEVGSSSYASLAEAAMLSLRVCDVACGSGHILLNAARRIATELAIVRTGEDQPSPLAFREAVRDVIRHCIYGVDLNPLAVELCKVALWLEAHVPGESLNFLDHHIKCGNAIVGLAHEAELQRGIPEEAFNRLPGDDKDIASAFRKSNQAQKEEMQLRDEQIRLDLTQTIRQELQPVSREYARLAALPDHSPADYEQKKAQFVGMSQRKDIWRLRTLANLQVAQFFIPKTPENKPFLCTEEEYRDYLTGKRHPQSQAVARANALWVEKHWFHWFIEFPDIFEQGGFDCILGNPPYLGGAKISTNYGIHFLNNIKTMFAPATGQTDYVAYFFRRIFDALRPRGFTGLISTNTICQGDTRASGLDAILARKGRIIFAVRSTPWPGRAAVNVSLLVMHKGDWLLKSILDNKPATTINSFLEDGESVQNPYLLSANEGLSFKGSEVVGDGFVLQPSEASMLLKGNRKNREVLFEYLSGDDLNSRPDQTPSRWVINFFDWSVAKAQEQYPECFAIVLERVKPERSKNKDKRRREIWWQFSRPTADLYSSTAPLQRVFAISEVTKFFTFSIVPKNCVYMQTLKVIALDTFHKLTILCSAFHEAWAWKYCSTFESRLRYTPSDAFENFPFPPLLNSSVECELEQIGERYHEHRRELMLKLQLGLTKTYNLFHDRDLSLELVAKESKQPVPVVESAHADLLQLRALHVQMDQTVLAAYGWHQPSDAGPAIALRHDFYEVDYLPENDRVRYTIHPDARKEILKRLLQLNHKLYAEEEAKGLHKKKTVKKAMPTPNETELALNLDLFGRAAETKETDKASARTPEFAPFTMAYPSGKADQLVCAFALELVEWRENISTADHLDALILATRPDLCRALLEDDNTVQLDIFATTAKKELAEITRQGLKWVECCTYLEERRSALAINRRETGRPVRKGAHFDSVRESLSLKPTPMALFALQVLDGLRDSRKRKKFSPQQVAAVNIFEQLHGKYALAYEHL